jgi:hypothetical protein
LSAEFEKIYWDNVEELYVQMKRFKISYYYCDSGMEGIANEFPECIIDAHNLDMAIFIYHLLYTKSYLDISFREFEKKDEVEKMWGISAIEMQKSHNDEAVTIKKSQREEMLEYKKKVDNLFDSSMYRSYRESLIDLRKRIETLEEVSADFIQKEQGELYKRIMKLEEKLNTLTNGCVN